MTRLAVFWLISLVLTAAAANAADQNDNNDIGKQVADQVDWTGTWDTRWRDGSAILTLKQEGDRVTGEYAAFGGRVEARAEGNSLIGRWIEADASGGLVFTLTEDGESFAGRFDNGEWWTGGRTTSAEDISLLFSNRNSPRETMRTFLAAGNEAIKLRFEGVTRALDTLDFGPSGAELSQGEKLLWARDLIRLMDMLTFNVWRLPDEAVADDRHTATLRQSGTDLSVNLTFQRQPDGSWVIEMPSRDYLQSKLADAVTNRGDEVYNQFDYLDLRDPRAVIEAFFEGTRTWEDGGEALVARTFDLSHLPNELLDFEVPIYADLMREVLNRVGFVFYQSISDSPTSGIPYVHYRHPVADIVIAPYQVVSENEKKEIIWKFTAETLNKLPELYLALEDLPVVAGLENSEPLTNFFRIRQEIAHFSPLLIERMFLFENWQWIGLIFVFAAGVVSALLVDAIMVGVLSWLYRTSSFELRRQIKTRFVWPLRILIAGLVWFTGLGALGMPDQTLTLVQTVNQLIIVVGATYLSLNLVGVIGGQLIIHAERTPGIMDDLVFSLGTGVLRAVVVIVGIALVADILGLPYEGVVAGLGVSGLALALAARETVQNFFGAAVLLTDRPFSKGDLVEVAGGFGHVERIGLRSTTIRTLDDSEYIIPNAQLANEVIDNRGRRRMRRIVVKMGLTYDTPPERLHAFVKRARETFVAQSRALGAQLYVGVTSFGASSIDVEVLGYAMVNDYDAEVAFRHDYIVDMVRVAEELGVEYAFPTRTLHLATGDAVDAENRALPFSTAAQ